MGSMLWAALLVAVFASSTIAEVKLVHNVDINVERGNHDILQDQLGLSADMPKKTMTDKKLNTDMTMGSMIPTSNNGGGDFQSMGKRDLKIANKTADVFEKLWGTIFGGRSGEQSSEESSEVGDALGFFKPWWFGPNVCKREEEGVQDADDNRPVKRNGSMSIDAQPFGGSFSGMSTSCADYGDAYKCTVRVMKNGVTHVKSQIFECCLGFGRERGQKGCPKAIQLKNAMNTLEQMNVTHFVDSMDEVGLGNMLMDNRSFTYFVPDNGALVSTSQLEDISFVPVDNKDKEKFAREVLKGHIVPGMNYSYLWYDERTLRTVDNASLIRINFFTYPRPFMTANCARITRSDIQASNGLIHMVDRVLMPATQSLWQMISTDMRFSTFASLVDADLQKKLSDPKGHWTLIPFTNDAFDKLPKDVQQAITNKQGCYKDIAREYVLGNTICSTAIFGHAAVKNLAGHYVNATRMDRTEKSGESIYFEGVKAMAVDRMATNGVMHIVNDVPLLESMMNPLSVLKKHEESMDFADLLTSNGVQVDRFPEATIFVPPEDSLRNVTGSRLQTILKNHVIGEMVEVGMDGNDTELFTSMAGQPLNLSVTQVFDPFAMDLQPIKMVAHIGCSRIVKANVRACGGIVHYIDKPLMVPDSDLVSALKSFRSLSTFVDLMKSSGLLDEINKPNFRGTVLAPINEGINETMSAETMRTLAGDKEKLRKFLARHILIEPLCQYEMCDIGGLFLGFGGHDTMSGDSVMGRGCGSSFRIDGVPVLRSDILATNGIVHILRRPLSRRRPSTILDILRVPLDSDFQ